MNRILATFVLIVLVTSSISAPALAQRPILHVAIAGAGPGAGAYVSAAAMAEFIRTRSGIDWIRATAQTTQGLVENVRLLGNKEVEMGLVAASDMYAALNNLPPYGEGGRFAYHDILAVLPNSQTATQWVTFDPNIRTLNDLVGRRINMGPPGSSSQHYGRMALEAAGIWDKVDKEYQSWSEGVRLMQDGLIDAFTVMGPWPFPAPLEAANIPGRTLYFIEIPEDIIEAVIREEPAVKPMVVPANSYGDGIPAQPVPSYGYMAYVAALAEVPEDAVYEMTRAMMSPEGQQFLSNLSVFFKTGFDAFPDAFFAGLASIGHKLHPGAARYYLEEGYDVPESILP